MSNNLIYTTGMTLPSSGNSSSQVLFKDNGRFANVFPNFIVFFFFLVSYIVIRAQVWRLLIPCQEFSPLSQLKKCGTPSIRTVVGPGVLDVAVKGRNEGKVTAWEDKSVARGRDKFGVT